MEALLELISLATFEIFYQAKENHSVIYIPRVSCKGNVNLEVQNQHSQTDTISVHWKNNAYIIRGSSFTRRLFAG